MLFSGYALLSLLLVLSHATTAQVNPSRVIVNNTITLPIAKRFNFTGSTTLLQHDQGRVRRMRARATGTLSAPSPELSSVDVTNELVQYFVEVRNELRIDIGSSNTWVSDYQNTQTTRMTRNTMVRPEFADRIMLGEEPGLEVLGQFIGIAASSSGFDNVGGVLGLGPTALTVGTLSPDTTAMIPTVTDNLFAQAVIPSEVVSISFAPTLSNPNGELTFGGIDSTKFIGELVASPITRTSPSSLFFGIEQSVRYGQTTTLLTGNPGIFDSGTTLILLATGKMTPKDALDAYVAATGAVFDEATGFYRITPAQYANLQSMFFTINGGVFEFTANAQIWPRSLNSLIGGSSSFVYLIIGDIGTPSGSGLDFINGMMFMERFYTVFDTGRNEIAIANTQFTTATTN
ncbi:acid protease [Cubamyces menziesii]|nr:acid protease [Cubamyces menziesii]